MPDIPQIWVGDDGISPIVEFDGEVPRIVDCEECPCDDDGPSSEVCLDHCDPAASSQMMLTVPNGCANSTGPSGSFVLDWFNPPEGECAWIFISANYATDPEASYVGFSWYLIQVASGPNRRWVARLSILSGDSEETASEDCLVNEWALPVDGDPIDCMASRELTRVFSPTACAWPCDFEDVGAGDWNDDLPETIQLVGA